MKFSFDCSNQTLCTGTNSDRQLVWGGDGHPRMAPFAVGEFANQPLYGEGPNMQGVYVEAEEDRQGVCLVDNFSQFCKITLKNKPYNDWNPKIVVWPTTSRQVQIAVRFARKHNLCVAVAGTGHDYLNRHSINNGMHT